MAEQTRQESVDSEREFMIEAIKGFTLGQWSSFRELLRTHGLGDIFRGEIPAEVTTEVHEPFHEMTNDELRSHLKKKGVEFASGDDKAELIRLARNEQRRKEK